MIDYKKLSHEYRDLYKETIKYRGNIKLLVLRGVFGSVYCHCIDKRNKKTKGRGFTLANKIIAVSPECNDEACRDILTSMVDHLKNEDYLLAANVGASIFEKNPLENYKDKDFDDFLWSIGLKPKK